jgi:hypothetical protein
MSPEIVPIWDSRRNTRTRWGVGFTTLDDLVATGKVQAKKLGKKTLINQPSMAEHLESLPAAPLNLTAKRRYRRSTSRAASREESTATA